MIIIAHVLTSQAYKQAWAWLLSLRWVLELDKINQTQVGPC